MGKKLTAEEVQKRLPDYITLVVDTYVDTKKKALFIDKDFGEFWCRFNDIHNGHGHRNRGYASPLRTKPPGSRPRPSEVVSVVLPEYLSLDASTYTNKKTIARFIDNKYGEFWAVPSRVLRGYGHPERTKDRVRVGLPDVIARLPVHLQIDGSTFVNIYENARFIDEMYGEFWRKPFYLIYGRGLGHPTRSAIQKKKTAEETCMARYGVKYVMQVPEIALKSAERANDSIKIPHWDGLSICICKASWEVAVVKYLNENKIPFKWQIPFRLANGSIYICDLYLVHDDKYVEIKGWFRKDALVKWQEFHSTYQNSELWDQKILKRMGLI